MYKFKNLVERNDFAYQFRKLIICYKRTGYNTNVMRQSACLVVNPTTVNRFAFFFNCMPAGQASALKKAPALKLSTKLIGA